MKDSCPDDSEETAMLQRLSLYVLSLAKCNILSKNDQSEVLFVSWVFFSFLFRLFVGLFVCSGDGDIYC